VVLGGLGGIVLVATVIRLGETNRQRVRLDFAGMAWANLALLRSPAFVGLAVCGACTSASWFTVIASSRHILAAAMRRPPSTYGLMILLQMAAAALGSFVVALLPYRNAFGMIALFGGFVAFGLAAAVFAVRWPPPPAAAEQRLILPGGARAYDGPLSSSK
jgi:hypothetical protein